MSKIEGLRQEMIAQGLTVERLSIALIDNGCELENHNDESLCRLKITQGDRHAEVVWLSAGSSSNGFGSHSMLVICDDPILRKAIGDIYIGTFFG